MNRNVVASLMIMTGLLFEGFTLPECHAQWFQQNSGTTGNLIDVIMLDSMTAIALGYNGTILKTTDAGTSWVPKMIGGPNWNAVSFAPLFPTAVQGIVVGNNSSASVTTDAGETWTTSTPSGTLGDFLSVACLTSTTMFLGTDSGGIFRTTNGGITWVRVFSTVFPVNDIFSHTTAISSHDLYTVLRWDQRAFRSTDQGASWMVQDLNMGINATATRGDFVRGGSGTAFIVGNCGQMSYSPLILRRTPQDTVWQRYFLNPNLFYYTTLRDVSAPSEEVAYTCGDRGTVFKTTDGGGFWDLLNSGTTRRLNAIHFVNTRRGFAVGDSGTILFTPNGGVIVSVDESEESPNEVRLFQNYPNPFNPTTTIQYSIPKAAHVSLVVFDVLGRQVAELESGMKAAGSYTINFDASHIASGVYMYRLKAGEFSSIRRMLVVK